MNGTEYRADRKAAVVAEPRHHPSQLGLKSSGCRLGFFRAG